MSAIDSAAAMLADATDQVADVAAACLPYVLAGAMILAAPLSAFLTVNTYAPPAARPWAAYIAEAAAAAAVLAWARHRERTRRAADQADFEANWKAMGATFPDWPKIQLSDPVAPPDTAAALATLAPELAERQPAASREANADRDE